MTDTIARLDDREDVRKTEYSYYDGDKNRPITVELWHDLDGLQRIAERAITNMPLSDNRIRKIAEKEALAVRETRVDEKTHWHDLECLYPDTAERLEESDDA